MLEVGEQVDDLSADRDIECGDGLVADDEFGLESEGSGYSDALSLASGELVGVSGDAVWAESDFLEDLLDPGFLVSPGGEAVDFHGVSDDVEDGHSGVEGADGVLENDLHLSTESAQGFGGEVEQGLPPEVHLAGGGAIEGDDGPSDSGLSATGLTDEAEACSFFYGEGDAVDGPDVSHVASEETGSDGKELAQVVDFQQRFL